MLSQARSSRIARIARIGRVARESRLQTVSFSDVVSATLANSTSPVCRSMQRLTLQQLLVQCPQTMRKPLRSLVTQPRASLVFSEQQQNNNRATAEQEEEAARGPSMRGEAEIGLDRHVPPIQVTKLIPRVLKLCRTSARAEG